MSYANHYNDPRYSDLTIKLSDDREIKLHKFVVCNKNAYFDKLCGEDSQFAESKQNLVVLREDEPDAVEQLLRHLYGFSLPYAREKSWRFWFTLVTAADKYLEPVLSEAASSRLMEAAEMQRSPDVVFDIIQDIKANMAHHESLLDFAERFRKQHLKGLLKNERYRDHLVSYPELVLAQLDELEVPRELVEKVCYVCDGCKGSVFQHPTPRRQHNCITCHKTNVYPGHTAYLPSQW